MARKLTKEEFVKKAKKLYGDKYDYSKVEYINSQTKVEIICPIHGSFFQKPNDHLMGHSCKKCCIDSKKSLISNVGINNSLDIIKKKNNVVQPYKQWSGMIHRCYDGKEVNYVDCSVCDEWLTYSNFLEWHNNNYVEGWELDKDLLHKGNRVYSPETCCFVPQEINSALTKTNAKRGEFPIGVTIAKNNRYKKYRAQINICGHRINLGCFYTIEEAYLTYKKAKEERLKQLADKWKDKLDAKVYQALYNYQVEITD